MTIAGAGPASCRGTSISTTGTGTGCASRTGYPGSGTTSTAANTRHRPTAETKTCRRAGNRAPDRPKHLNGRNDLGDRNNLSVRNGQSSPSNRSFGNAPKGRINRSSRNDPKALKGYSNRNVRANRSAPSDRNDRGPRPNHGGRNVPLARASRHAPRHRNRGTSATAFMNHPSPTVSRPNATTGGQNKTVTKTKVRSGGRSSTATEARCDPALALRLHTAAGDSRVRCQRTNNARIPAG